MPRRKKKQSTFKRFAKGATSAIGIASSALSIAKHVKSLINVEYKYFDQSNTGTLSALGTMDIFYLNGIAQGDTEITRNGDSIKAKSLSVRGYLVNQQAAPIQANVWIVRDTMDQGSSFSGGDFLDTPGDILSYRNLNNGKRFKVLGAKRMLLPFNSDTTTGGLKYFNFNFKLNNHIKFTGTTGGGGDAGLGSYYLCIMNSSAANYPTYQAESRLRYIDN